MTLLRRRLLIATAVLLVLAASLLGAYRLALQQLRQQLVTALGPRASVGLIEVGWQGLSVQGLRIRAAPGWPAEDELRAERLRLRPDLRSLLGGPWRVASLEIAGAYLSALRSRDGRLRLLPALLEREGATTPGSASSSDRAGTPLVIAKIHLEDSSLDFFDASVRRPPLALRLEQLSADVGPLHLPALDQAIQLRLDGIFKGPRQDGRLHVAGAYTPASQDAQIEARFEGVDLLALQPYLLKVSEQQQIRRGSADLTLNARVEQQRLHAPGKLVLHELQLASSGGTLSHIAGVPAQALLAALSRDGKIEVKFTLDGRLDDPGFSLNESLSTRIASGLAEGLGVSLSGVVQGLGNVVKGLFGK